MHDAYQFNGVPQCGQRLHGDSHDAAVKNDSEPQLTLNASAVLVRYVLFEVSVLIPSIIEHTINDHFVDFTGHVISHEAPPLNMQLTQLGRP